MKTQFVTLLKTIVLLCCLTPLLFASRAGAQLTTNNYIYAGNQSASPGTNWSGPGVTVGAYWKLNGLGAAVQPSAGTATATTTNYNIFNLNSNGVALGAGTTTTLIRDPYTSPYPTIATFPGDSLVLNTNTQIRFKHGSSSGTLVPGVGFNFPTNNFPGNFGLPGLVLNGGCLNAGDSGYAYAIMGTMYAVPGTISYLDPADTFASDGGGIGGGEFRALVINAQLSGSGTLALLNATTNNSAGVPQPVTANGAGVPQTITGLSNYFTGTWVVRAGWLQGLGDGTGDGYNSLGTNVACHYIIDPLWQVPNTFAAGSTFIAGPAVLDMGSSLANCAGALVLTNGGQLYLHGNVLFSSVNIEGFSLTNGTYSYATLASTFTTANGYQNNFAPVGFPAGSGTLTVQPFGNAVFAPLMTLQPVSEILYPGRTAVFTATGNGTLPLYYQWQKGGAVLNNGPTGSGSVVSGATTTNLTISNVSHTDNANYTLLISNVINTVTSTQASLTVVTPVEPYETAVSILNPVAFYQFNEFANPASGNAEAFDFAGGFNGTYGSNVLNGFNGIVGPTADTGFPGFVSINQAASFTPSVAGDRVSVPSWNLNTNTVTLCGWINPGGSQLAAAGLIYCRGADTVAGLCYDGILNPNTGVYDLGYNWNNDPNVYNWDSGLSAPVGQWSFVALVVTPNAATIYLMNTNGLTSSTQVYPHSIQPFSSADTTLIGDDSLDGGNGSRTFAGMMDDAAVFNTALTGDQVANLFYTATGVSSYAPVIGVQPQPTNAYTSQTISLNVGAYGSAPLGYQWFSATTGSGGPYTALVNGPGANGETISGAQSATLTIHNVALADALDYEVIVTNNALNGSATSSVATVTVTLASAAQNIIMNTQEAAGADWNTGSYWSDGNAASVSVVSEPGSTYEMLQGSRLRTPNNALQAVFPGNQLTNDGTGVFINNPGAGTVQAEIRSKQGVPPSGPATVTFPLLIMAGGQFDNGNPGVIDIEGQIEVVSNAIFYVDNSGGSGRPIQIDAYITGNNNIEFRDFDVSMTGGLVVTCPSNTYSGTWNVVQGPLIAAGTNCLGTNSITVGVNGAFETLYDVHSPSANLILGGVMYLHQNDTFHSLILGSTALTAGTYTAAQLHAVYPAYFPTNWAGHYGSMTQTTASGSITVLASLGATVIQNPTPAAVSLYPTQTTQFSALGGGNPPLYYNWQLNGTNLTDNGNFIGSLSNVLTVANIMTNNGGNYTIVISNSLGSVTSAPAILTLLPTQPPIQPITLSGFEASGADWNTVGQWNDGQGGLPASTSALEYPGSTYEVLAGAGLRTPAAAVPYTNFPGASLTVDGSGVWVNINPAAGGSAQGEIRFKPGQNQEAVYFPLLIMNGGQLDNGSSPSAVVVIQGQMEIVSNTPIYVDSGGAEGRSYQIDACLTGNASIEYHDFDASMIGGLDITCPTNSYTGTWNIVQGPLLGAGINSLGTNSITIGTKGALETLYDIHSPGATLTLNGVMYLHQNDTFYQMAVNGTGVPAGVYSYAQLLAAYPTTFPATWTSIYGSAFSTASGSITVLNSLITAPVINSQPPAIAEEFAGAQMVYSVATGGNQPNYQWFLNDSAITGATNAAYAFISLAGTNTYYCVATNMAGIATSMVVTNIAGTPSPILTFDDTANWILQGTGITPSLGGDDLTLTDNTANEAATAFYDIAQYIEGFNATFTYTPSGSLAADGVTFCVQNSANGPAALGGGGGNLGYFGIDHSAAVEFNIYALATGGVGFGFGTNGTIANPYMGIAPVSLAGGNPINVTLNYLQGHMKVSLTDNVSSATYVTNLTIADYAAVLGDTVGYVGFTGADGGSVSSQEVSNFNFVPVAAPVLAISVSGNSATLNWSSGVSTNLVLKQSSSLTGPWAVVGTPALVGGQYQIVVTPTNSMQFFILSSP